ncbi:MAG: hypothetical protein ACKO8U_03440 [Pirellula sp.]
MASAAMVFGSDFNQSGTANWATRDIRQFRDHGSIVGRDNGIRSYGCKAWTLGYRT